MRLNRAYLALAALALLLAVPRADASQLHEEAELLEAVGSAGAPAPAPLPTIDPGAALAGSTNMMTGCTIARRDSLIAACFAKNLGSFCNELLGMLGELCTHYHTY